MSKIKNKVYKLKDDIIGPFNINFKKDSELHIVEDVVYMNGFPLPFEMQTEIYIWVINNPNMFTDNTFIW